MIKFTKLIKNLFQLLFAALVLFSCDTRAKFVGLEEPPVKFQETNLEFKIESSTQMIEQLDLDRNYSYLAFQVKKADGNYLPDLTAADFTVSENNVAFNQFKFYI